MLNKYAVSANIGKCFNKKKTEWFEDLSALQEILGNRYNDRIRVDL